MLRLKYTVTEEVDAITPADLSHSVNMISNPLRRCCRSAMLNDAMDRLILPQGWN